MSHSETGFTLVEMIIVIFIAAIIMAIALPPLHRWVVRYNVNKETADIYNLLTEMRFRSLAHKNKMLWGVKFTSSSMTTFGWDDANFDGQVSSDEEKSMISYNLNYPLSLFPDLRWFDGRGVIRTSTGAYRNATIRINTNNNLPAGDAHDCIAISSNRIREGKYDSSNSKCVVR